MSDSRPSLRQRTRYHFENLLSRGPLAIIGLLFIGVAAIVLAGALLIVALGLGPDDAPLDFAEAAWNSLMHQIDSGMVTGDSGWPFRLVAFLVTLGGIFIFSSLIGVISTGLQDRLDNLRKGRSAVIESGHTLILGWSPKVFTIVSELVEANRSERRPRIVILAPKDKVEMEDELRERIDDFGRTKVVCRSGNPIDPTDRDLVNPNGAKSIIVLAPEDAERPDIPVVKAVLALTNNPGRRPEPYHIVAELADPAYREAAALVGGDEACFIEGDELIARLTAQTCRQSGLSVVYTELLDFGGSEIYIAAAPSLVGKTFREACAAYPASVPIGLLAADGSVRLNPPPATRIGEGDRIIGIAEDDSTFLPDPSSVPAPDESAIALRDSLPPSAENVLILGWNPKLPVIAAELDGYLASGSRLVVMADLDPAEAQGILAGIGLRHQTPRFVRGDATRRDDLEALGLDSYADIIVLGDVNLPLQEADARTLITLLHLRQHAAGTGRDLKIVSEMFDVRNRDLAEVSKADDFIVSDRLVSLMLAQISENRHLKAVFADLFSPDGAEIYLRPIDEYVIPGREVSFATLCEAAARKGHTAIGWRRLAFAHEAGRGYGIAVNPPKAERAIFEAADQLIVIAE